ncbi:MAG: hypothetical protein ACO1NO_14545 [Burkholderiaceae bacterium]
MTDTLIRIYDELAQAENARDELLRAGFAPSRMHLSVRDDESGPVEGNFYVGDPVDPNRNEHSRHEGVSGFLKSLIDSDKDDYNGTFRHTVQRATYMLTIQVSDAQESEAACAITARHGALPINNGSCSDGKDIRPSA